MEQNILQANAARAKVLPAAQQFEPISLPEGSKLDNAFEGKVGGQVVGRTGQITVKGYGGEIEIVVGLNAQGTIAGISVGGGNFAETAGLGAKIKESAFTDQFKGLSGELALGQNVDAVAGATISSSAVTAGVNQVLSALQAGSNKGDVESLPASARVETVVVEGYADEIEVVVGMTANGVIEYVQIGGPSFDETAGLGARVQDQAFRDQFVGKSGKLSYGDGIDAISGATVTSKAVLQAINEALAAGNR